MSAREILEAIFAISGCAIVVWCCIGLLIGDVFDRLHFLGPATVFAPWLLLIAVLIRFASVESAVKMVLLTLAVILTSPILTHGTALTFDLKRRHSLRSDEKA